MGFPLRRFGRAKRFRGEGQGEWGGSDAEPGAHSPTHDVPPFPEAARCQFQGPSKGELMVPIDGPADRAEDLPDRLLELDWDEISEPGCYMLISSGLLARVYPDEARARRQGPRSMAGARVVKLSNNPGDPLQTLRAIAERHGYPVRF